MFALLAFNEMFSCERKALGVMLICAHNYEVGRCSKTVLSRWNSPAISYFEQISIPKFNLLDIFF